MSSDPQLRTISFDDQDAIRAAIRNHESFEVGGCHDRMDDAVLFVERAIGGEGMTSRVFTQGRMAALAAGLVAAPAAAAVAVGLAAHNLATLNPDYEVMKRPLERALRLTYVKNDPTLGERIKTAATTVGEGISTATSKAASAASEVSDMAASAWDKHAPSKEAVIGTAVLGVFAPAVIGKEGVEAAGAKTIGGMKKMFNAAMKEEAVTALNDAQTQHEIEAKVVGEASARLFELRRSSSEQIIAQVEGYINSLANSPKEFDKTFSEYRAEFETFSEIIAAIEEEAAKTGARAGAGAAAGVATGIGVAAFAPSAAMAIATTFGTASTGTAISTLSGAAATNAALAWLGGGALATGGGGIAAGEAFLALAGPVGWALGGTALVAAGLFARSRNRAIAEDAAAEIKKIQSHIAALSAAKVEINHLFDLTERHVDGVTALLAQLREWAPRDYHEFSSDQKERLGALINHIHSLSELLNMKVQA